MLLEQRRQRILSHLRIQVEHQAILIVADRLEREHLRCDGLLQVKHQSDDVGPVLRNTQAADVGVVRTNLAHEFVQRGAHVEPLDVDHHPVGVLESEVFCLQLAVEFQCDAGVLVGGPGPHGQQAGSKSQPRQDRKDEQRRRPRQEAAASYIAGGSNPLAVGISSSSHVVPLSVYALRVARRPFCA